MLWNSLYNLGIIWVYFNLGEVIWLLLTYFPMFIMLFVFSVFLGIIFINVFLTLYISSGFSNLLL